MTPCEWCVWAVWSALNLSLGVLITVTTDTLLGCLLILYTVVFFVVVNVACKPSTEDA